MMQEIYQRGPIACGVAVPAAMENYTSGIFEDKTGDTDIVHDISVVGYGVEKGTKFWVVRNSWGSHWGEQGFMRIVRGVNNIAIESDCAWATPKDTWTNDVRHKTTDEERKTNIVREYKVPQKNDLFGQKKGCRVPKATFPGGEKRPEVHAWEEIDVETLPDNFDWGHIKGDDGKTVSYLSWNKNQHIPVYCGSCWAQGPTSSMADRFNIMMKNKNPTPVGLNAQVIVNCEAGGDCEGGNPGGVYEYGNRKGFPDSSCEQYVALDLEKQGPHHRRCEDIDLCKDCAPPPCPAGKSCEDKCWAVKHKKYYVSNYYSLSGASKMKAEIYKNGPISCGIEATDKFENDYHSGIYSEFKLFPMINHEIAVVGWGKDEKSG